MVVFRPLNCDCAEFLLTVDSEWSQPTSLLLRYRIRQNGHVHYVNLISNRTVERWITDTFILIPTHAVHELCYQVCLLSWCRAGLANCLKPILPRWCSLIRSPRMCALDFDGELRRLVHAYNWHRKPSSVDNAYTTSVVNFSESVVHFRCLI